MERGLKCIMFYVKKHTAPPAMCYDPPLVRDKPLRLPAFVKLVYLIQQNAIIVIPECDALYDLKRQWYYESLLFQLFQ